MKITKLGHACLLVEQGEGRLLIDPGAYSSGFEELRNLDAVLVTHQHPDHITPDTLSKVREGNPDVLVYADAGTAKMLEKQGVLGVTVVHEGDEFEVKGVKLAVFGKDHAIIYSSIPKIENVGYLIAGRLFVPGDNFTVPSVPVEILALPLGAPWLKLSEMIDYLLAVNPKVAIPVHDGVLAMPEMNITMAKLVTDSAGMVIQAILNGESAEF
jgi:L-ascorbate metabolism protein UlaG (beta-lactamase superfamily)